MRLNNTFLLCFGLILMAACLVPVNCQEGSVFLVGGSTGSAELITQDKSNVSENTFTYIPLRDLLSLDSAILSDPCASPGEFANYNENIDRWTQILTYPEELNSDYILLGQVRGLIAAAKESANQVQKEFELQVIPEEENLLVGEQVFAQVQMNTPLNAFL